MFNIVRKYPAPLSLASKVRYDSDDVLLDLKEIFFNKCYLCESKDPQSVNVEHFDPHQGDVNKKFNWDNLFFACARCNNIKLAKFKNIINCSDPNTSAWQLIKLLPPRSPGGNVEVFAMNANASTLETRRLLDDIYNSEEKSMNKRMTARYLRKSIYAKVRRFLDYAERYYNDETPAENRREALATMKEMMLSKQEFSAFLRWITMDDKDLSVLLQASIVD